MHTDQPEPTLWLTEYHTPSDAYCHGIIEVLYQARTKHQDILIVNTGAYGKALVLDGCWQCSTGDEFMYHEPLVHPASVLAGGPVNVLVLGGGDGATLREVLKWRSVRRAVLVDLDEQVVEACRRYLPEMHQGSLNDPRVEVRIADAYDFFDTDGSKWDLIISDLTDPVESGPSYKLFSQHYFRKCRQALSIGGCFVLQAGLAGPVEMHLHVQIARSVGRVFDRMWHFISPVPTWASPMGFVIGTGSQVEWNDPEPLHIDDLLKHKTNGRFRMFDGRVMRGLMHPPKYLREAVGVDL